MADYWRDWRDINANSGESELKRAYLDRIIRKVRKKMERRGIDVDNVPQADLIKGMFEDPKTKEEAKKVADEYNRMMYRFVSARLLRSDYSDWTGWQHRSWFAIEVANHPQRWRGEKVRSVAVISEQGVGDEILFGSCVPDLQKLGIEVTIECDPRIQKIFERSLGCKTRPRDDVVNRTTSNYVSMKRPEDAIVPAGDIVKMFRRKKQDFPKDPYLRPDPEKVKKWEHLKGRVGIAWRGRRGKFDPKQLKVENPVCLQYDSWDYETEGMTVPDIDLRNDLEDVMGICANLERVVTVPQTVVHLAGAQGVPVEVVIPPVASAAREETQDQLNWRYGKGGRMDWYSSVTVYRSLYALSNR